MAAEPDSSLQAAPALDVTTAVRRQPRPYQLELFEAARKQNIVAYLDTGAGKTLISVLLLTSMAEPLCPTQPVQQTLSGDRTSIGTDGGIAQPPTAMPTLETISRKAVFLVPTVPLVAQQANRIRRDTDLTVGEYAKDDSRSILSRGIARWTAHIAQKQVLVMTPQVLLNLLRHGYLNLSAHINLLVIDECHHAAKQHPYSVLMRDYFHSIPSGMPRPKVLGMTASPIHQRAVKQSVSARALGDLQTTLGCRVVTITDRRRLEGFVPRAAEVLLEYENAGQMDLKEFLASLADRTTQSAAFCRFYLVRFLKLVDMCNSAVNINEPIDASIVGESAEINSKATLRSVMNKLSSSITAALADLGIWAAARVLYQSCNALETQIKHADCESDDPPNEPIAKRLKSDTGSTVQFVSLDQHLVEQPPLPLDLSQMTDDDLSEKVKALFRVLCEHANSNGTQSDPSSSTPFRALVFVSQRWIASALCDLINAQSQSRFPNIKCGYVTGHGASVAKSGSSSMPSSATGLTLRMNGRIQQTTFEKFRSGQLNILIVTSVAEEGLDIPDCRLVVAFDLFRNQTGYVQSRGRARNMDGATYVIMVKRGDTKTLQSIAEAKISELTTLHLTNKFSTDELTPYKAASHQDAARSLCVMRGDADERIARLLLGSYSKPLVTANGAILHPSGAVALLHWFDTVRGSSISLRGRRQVAPQYRVVKGTGVAMQDSLSWQTYLMQLADQSYSATQQVDETDAVNDCIDDVIVECNRTSNGACNSDDDDSALWTDELDVLQQTMVDEPTYGWICSVQLSEGPPCVIKPVYSMLRLTLKMARQHAAFRACQLLYAAGELDEYLQPKRHVKRLHRTTTVDNDNDASRHESDDGQQEDEINIRTFTRSVPRAFTKPTNEPTLHSSHRRSITLLNIQRAHRDRKCMLHQMYASGASDYSDKCRCRPTAFAISSHAPIPCSRIPHMRFWDNKKSPSESITVTCEPWMRSEEANSCLNGQMAIEFTDAQMHQIVLFQIRLFDILLSRRSRGDHFADASQTARLQHRSYELIPMQYNTGTSSWSIDWNFIKLVAGESRVDLHSWISACAVQYNHLDNMADSSSCHQALYDAISNSESPIAPFEATLQSTASSPEQLRMIDSVLSEVVVKQILAENKYMLDKLAMDMNANTQFSLQRGNRAEMISFLAYWQSKGYTIEHPQAALIQAKELSQQLHSYLHPQQRTSSSTVASSQKANRFAIHLPSEVCQVMPFPKSIYETLLILPSILYRIDMFCLLEDYSVELSAHLDIPQEARPMPLTTLRSALTSPGANDDADYERLETLGDAFLKFGVSLRLFEKYPRATSGELSVKRSAIVSNRNLLRVAISSRITSVTTMHPFVPRLWAHSHDQPWNTLAPAVGVCGESADETLVGSATGRKTLADFIEALLGAYYVEYGQHIGMRLLDHLGLGANSSEKPTDAAQTADALSGIQQSTAAIAAAIADVSASIAQIEARLGYKFKTPSLLLEAITDASISPSDNYDRLEFLGDAVLDCLLMRRFYTTYRDISPAVLSDLRIATASNETLCWLATQLGLHHHIRRNTPSTDVERYITHLATLEHGKIPVDTAYQGPKILADVFEAVMGALFLDAGQSLDQVWTIIEPILTPFLKAYATPETLVISPVRQLMQYLQAHKIDARSVIFEYKQAEGDSEVLCSVSVHGTAIGSGAANSKPRAKRLACQTAFEWVQESGALVIPLIVNAKHRETATVAIKRRQ